MQLAVLVASSMGLCQLLRTSCVTQVPGLSARQRWKARCPAFADVHQALEAPDLGSYVGHQVTRGLEPLDTCIHLLLYVAVAPSPGYHHLCCLGCQEGPDPREHRALANLYPSMSQPPELSS